MVSHAARRSCLLLFQYDNLVFEIHLRPIDGQRLIFAHAAVVEKCNQWAHVAWQSADEFSNLGSSKKPLRAPGSFSKRIFGTS